MSRSEIERFVRDAGENEELLQELTQGSLELADFVLKAQRCGYDFSLDEAKRYLRQHAPEASEEELGRVAGGLAVVTTPAQPNDPALVTQSVEVTGVVTTADFAQLICVVTAA